MKRTSRASTKVRSRESDGVTDSRRKRGSWGEFARLSKEGITIEADPALIEKALEQLGLSGATAVKTPAARTERFEPVTAEEVVKRRAHGSKPGTGVEKGSNEKAEQKEEENEDGDRLMQLARAAAEDHSDDEDHESILAKTVEVFAATAFSPQADQPT